MADHIVPVAPRIVLDVATGTAGVAIHIAGRTKAFIAGIDLTEPMLRRGRHNLARNELSDRVTLLSGRAEQLPHPDAIFDALTFTYLLRYVADPAATLRELVRVLKPGAPMASLEFLVPGNRFWRFWWWSYTRLALPVLGRLFGREWYEVGRFLGPSISRHYQRYPVSWTKNAWEDAGMVDVAAREMSVGGGLIMWGRKADG
jgi:demethylmenaquinone methyltransferase/2-methoxy-6-polyprenyl-1,4-benzoquinol methylase